MHVFTLRCSDVVCTLLFGQVWSQMQTSTLLCTVMWGVVTGKLRNDILTTWRVEESLMSEFRFDPLKLSADAVLPRQLHSLHD